MERSAPARPSLAIAANEQRGKTDATGDQTEERRTPHRPAAIPQSEKHDAHRARNRNPTPTRADGLGRHLQTRAERMNPATALAALQPYSRECLSQRPIAGAGCWISQYTDIVQGEYDLL